MFIDPSNLEHSLQISIAPPCANDYDLPARGIVGRLFDWLALCANRRHQRRTLETLSDHVLRDIGLSRAEVEAEIVKPFWRP